MKRSYSQGILDGFHYLLSTYPEVFVFGQGLWSPWYVGASMTDLDKIYGQDRIIDSPVSELGVTGAGLGAALCGKRPIIVHPRIDFMLLAVDQIVTQAAKWSSMFGGQADAPLTIRGIINRGGEQGAQHSQALQSWFAHIPGLRVVMPATALDARDLFIASVLSNDPVLFIDDRWLYEQEEEFPPITEIDLSTQGAKVIREGSDVTLVGCGFGTLQAQRAAEALATEGISAEVVDLRVLNPLKVDAVITSVKKTGRLVAVDYAWKTCGIAGEIIASVSEVLAPDAWKVAPKRFTLPDAPAPTAKILEDIYYPSHTHLKEFILETVFIRTKV